MAIGEKYAPLGNWLKEHGGDSVKLTFDELNQIIPIPNHAYKNRPSWANLSNPASFCSSWISAGYVVDSISLEEQWVIFRKGEVQGHTHHSKPPYRVVDQKKLAEAIQAGYECYDSMKDDPHHRYLSWEYCHEAFRLNRRPQIDATIDYLCLHLAWYLASWGKLLYEMAVDIMEEGGHDLNPVEASALERAEVERRLNVYLEQLPEYQDRISFVFERK